MSLVSFAPVVGMGQNIHGKWPRPNQCRRPSAWALLNTGRAGAIPQHDRKESNSCHFVAKKVGTVQFGDQTGLFRCSVAEAPTEIVCVPHRAPHCTVIGSQGGASRHHRAGSWRAYCFVRRRFSGESKCVTAGTKRNVDNNSAPNDRRAGRQ
jgi:hypothetical protein